MQQALEKLASMKNSRRQKVIDALVEEAIRCMKSQIGYFASMNDAEDVLTMLGWSKTAMAACTMIDKPIVYPLEETGLWGDAVRERKPVITNNYANCSKPTKKGYPEGHVRVVHHVNVPVWEADHIAGVLGVGNKAEPYTDEEAKLLEDLAKQAWPYIKQAKE
jgi:GAF domain-containing protein